MSSTQRNSNVMREHARAIWHAAVQAVAPDRLIQSSLRVRGRVLEVGPLELPLERIGSIAVIGAGKAGSAMSCAVEKSLGDRIARQKRLHGCVNVPDPTRVPLQHIHLHPARMAPDNKPTEAGVVGSRRIQSIVESLGPNDLGICLLSGGGSALLPAPVHGVSLADKQKITGLLHESGATIGELNAVRKHLSVLKGGGLVGAFRGRWLVSLIISDVVGDPLDTIASGPTAADPSRFADALEVLRKYKLEAEAPRSIRDYLAAGAAGARPETLKRLPAHVHNCVIGNSQVALEAAARAARKLGYRVLNLGSFLEGDSRQLGLMLAGIARGCRDQHRPFAPPLCILSGGETTVRLQPGHGLGGRNQELVLAALEHLGRRATLRDIVLLCGGTDGEDGPTEAAGAVADEKVWQQAVRKRLDVIDYLDRHDSYHFFEPLGALLKTGLTNTNVMDVRVFLVGPPPSKMM